MRVDFHRSFDKHFRTLPQNVRERFKARLVLFAEDRTNPLLNNHRLKGKYAGYRSINVTGDIRAIFIEHSATHVEFVEIGPHSKLYE